MNKNNKSKSWVKVADSIWLFISSFFVCLKLVGLVDWPWYVVTMPFWGGLCISFGVMILVLTLNKLKKW